jgi:enoyl-CoA hydratase/carnithine racemase
VPVTANSVSPDRARAAGWVATIAVRPGWQLSELPVVTIAKLRSRARGAGSELALACDMRFAARENAILGQPEAGFGTSPGAGGVQHLARLLGRGRAMEAILGADDFDAETAERYGWINRALPDADLDAFVARLARRIASFPTEAVRSTKQVLNELTLPGADAIRADARRFHQLVGSDTVRARAATLFAQGLQTSGPLELDLGDRIGSLLMEGRVAAGGIMASALTPVHPANSHRRPGGRLPSLGRAAR